MAIAPEDAAVLLARVQAGDQGAWNELVDAFAGLVWAIARQHRLSDSDAADVSQTTWLRLVENIGRIEDPRRVGAWLATTARRECLRVLRMSGRQRLAASDNELEHSDPEQIPVDGVLLQEEQATAVRIALVRLPDHCQQLLRSLMVDEPPSYQQLSASLGIPIGSIGPTRGRCLDKLRVLMEQDQAAATG